MAVPNAYNKLVGEVGAIVEPKVLFLSLPFEKKYYFQSRAQFDESRSYATVCLLNLKG